MSMTLLTPFVRFRAIFCAVLLSLVSVLVVQARQSSGTVVILVRHAEKVTDDPSDPDPVLTLTGRARATALGKLLADAGVTQIHSTDFRRTRQTVDSLVKQLALEVQIYDPRDLPGFADQLRASPGIHVVSGHSNTTPSLVKLLGGEPGEPIVEATEYDRLYVLTLLPEGRATTVILRYGD